MAFARKRRKIFRKRITLKIMNWWQWTVCAIAFFLGKMFGKTAVVFTQCLIQRNYFLISLFFREPKWYRRHKRTVHLHTLPWVQWLLSNNNNLSVFHFFFSQKMELMSSGEKNTHKQSKTIWIFYWGWHVVDK